MVFDKVEHELQLWKTSLYCVKHVQRYPLDDIIAVRPYKKGHAGINVYTLHYKIMIFFRDNCIEPIKLTDTASEEKCVKQVWNLFFIFE